MPDDMRVCLSARDISAEQSARMRRAKADEACLFARDRAERLAALLDRYDNDAGENADAIAVISADIERLVARVVALLGEPAKPLIVAGRIVGLVRT